ncbi:DsbA family oxidoreductase [Methyloceanibacter caenitepidi]|uniref:DsbA-like thioredoxin domain protein n=1 Tax=Methyloceanibacter caenitepidi TaxID=1384459 RepID=A0A0A8K2X8_9HYPH|nr:DsbA family protein [Methyloceanibacter caenitepidi]BAQ17308.1 DsbA-like thioredoxin domain protein [Methyloceanibacter caenitepidi]
MSKVEISYYSDVLCIWAYVAERRLDELAAQFGDQIEIVPRYCSVFPDAWGKIEAKGGFEHFNEHLKEVAARFPHIVVSDQVWLRGRPRTSASPHQFLKAVELVERSDGAPSPPYLDRLTTRAARNIRHAFFAEALDIGDWTVQRDIAARLGIDADVIERRLRSSEALAALVIDYGLAAENGIAGSPTFLMNDGRQKLFGNVGYRLLEANVQELLRGPAQDGASWC